MLAHDLRNPLTAASLALETIGVKSESERGGKTAFDTESGGSFDEASPPPNPNCRSHDYRYPASSPGYKRSTPH